MKVGATSYDPPELRRPAEPIWVTAAVEPPLPRVTLLLFVSVPLKRLTRGVTIVEMAGPRVTPKGLSTLMPSRGGVTAPVPVYVCASPIPKK